MAKYAQTKKDREDESRGMSRYERHRRESGGEGRFDGMIHEDHSAPANLPRQSIEKEYPKNIFEKNVELDDTIRGIDDYARDYARKVDASMRRDMY